MSSINTRLKELRKKEKLSQKVFGEKIFLSQDQISLLEQGKRNLTDRSINDICREFSVNKEWLIDGKGEIYLDCLKDLDIEKEVKEITNMLFELDEDAREAITNMITLLKNKKINK